MRTAKSVIGAGLGKTLYFGLRVFPDARKYQMTTTTITLQGTPRTHIPRLAQPIGRAIAGGIALLATWMRPRSESPAEAAARLRTLANQYITQPSFAADLRAAADRHEQDHGIQ